MTTDPSSSTASNGKPHNARINPWFIVVVIIGGIFFLIWGIRAFCYEPFNIPSESMLPTLPKGSVIIVAKWGYGHYTSFGFGLKGRPISAPLAAGDLIVFDYPVDHSTSYIKRLIGLPGDTVDYHDKQLTVNGKVWTRSKKANWLNDESLRYYSRFSESNGRITYDTLADDDRPVYELGGVSDFPHKENCQYDSTGFRCRVPPGHYFMMGDNRDNTADSRYWGFVPADHILGKVVNDNQ